MKCSIEIEVDPHDENVCRATIASFYIKMLEAIALNGCGELSASLAGDGFDEPIEVHDKPDEYEWGINS